MQTLPWLLIVAGDSMTALPGLGRTDGAGGSGMHKDAIAARALAEVAEVAEELYAQRDLDGIAHRAVHRAVDLVGCHGAGIMLIHSGSHRRRVETIAVTDPLVAKADSLQLEFGEGPCLTALEDRDSYRITDTATETRWAQWCRQVAELGLRSILGIDLTLPARGSGRRVIGALNLYGVRPEAFDDADQMLVEVLARHVAIAMDAAGHVANLERAVDTRAVVGRAQGMLIERYKISSEQAFALLRRYSQDTNTKLSEIAEQLITTGQLPGLPAPHE